MPPRKPSAGMSVVEIMIVAALASVILMGATIMMGRTTRSFKKGTDMLNTQVLMDSIVERLRTDVRSLKFLVPAECSDDGSKFVFLSIVKGQPIKIKYEFEPPAGKDKAGTLYRTEGTKARTSFHGANQVLAFVFQPFPTKSDFRHLNVAMQVVSDEKGEGANSRLSIVCQFHSTCLESFTPFGRN